MRQTLTGWKPIAARLLKGPNHKHLLFVQVREEAVHAVVLGAASDPPPVDDMVERELRAYRDWLVRSAGTDVTKRFDLEAIGAGIGTDTRDIGVIKAKYAGNAAHVLEGMLKFFDREPKQGVSAITVGERIYLFNDLLLQPKVTRAAVVEALSRHVYEVVQHRRHKRAYLSRWVGMLTLHAYEDHPMRRAAQAKAAAAVKALQ